MLGPLRTEIKGTLLRNPHFWAIIAISLFLIFIYQAWPWREWKFTDGIWRWFPWLSSLYGLAIFESMYHIVGIIFFAPIIYAVVILSWQGALVTSLLSIGGVLPIIVNMWAINSKITNLALLMMPFLIALTISLEVKWHRNERRIFAEREEERLLYISKVHEAQEKERQRIARDLHDEIIQTLLAVANRAENLLSDKKNIEIQRHIVWIREMTVSMAERLRRISLDLRPSILDDLGLLPALRWLVDNLNEEYDIHTRIIVNGVEHKLPPQLEVHIFRIVQEALNNIKHHSGASKAVVTLEFNVDNIKIKIEDNGQGFHPLQNITDYALVNKLGLVGIQERIESLGGIFRIRSISGTGTTIFIEIEL